MPNSIKGPLVGYTDILDNEINEKLLREQTDRLAGKVKYHPLRPSAAGQCSRLLALNLMEYRGKATYPNRPMITPALYRLFDMGHGIERDTLKHFYLVKGIDQRYKQQVLTFFEVPNATTGKPDLIEGSCDFVFYSARHRGIGDCKSKKDSFSQAFRTKWDEELAKFSNMASLQTISDNAFYADDLTAFIDELGYDYLVDNLLQLNLYATNSFMQERGVDHAFLYRLNKNDSRHMEIRFKPSQEVANYVQEKFTRVANIVDNNETENMVCEYPIGSIKHAYCDCHKVSSYAEHDPIKSYYKTLPPKVWPRRTSELPNGSKLESLFKDFEAADKASSQKGKVEQEIIALLTPQKVAKVQFDSGAIYTIKYLKTPKEHFELRKDKL